MMEAEEVEEDRGGQGGLGRSVSEAYGDGSVVGSNGMSASRELFLSIYDEESNPFADLPPRQSTAFDGGDLLPRGTGHIDLTSALDPPEDSIGPSSNSSIKEVRFDDTQDDSNAGALSTLEAPKSPLATRNGVHRTASVTAQPPTPPGELEEASIKHKGVGWSQTAPLASGSTSPWHEGPLSPDANMEIPDKIASPSPSPIPSRSAPRLLEQEVVEAASSQWMHVSISDPRKVSDALRSYVVYTVKAQTNLTGFSSKSAVHRRYNDFVWLYNALVANNPGIIVPVVPEKQALNRFADDFIAHRLTQLQRFTLKVSRHPVLRTDPDFRLFLESDKFAFDIKYKKDENIVPPTKSGFLSLGRGSGREVEYDEYLESRKVQLTQLEISMRNFYLAVDTLAKYRKGLSQALEASSQPFTSLAESAELSPPIRNVLKHLSQLQIELRAVHDVHLKGQIDGLANVVGEYARLIDSVKLAYAGRISTWSRYLKLDAELQKARQSYERSNREQRSLPEAVNRMLSDLSHLEKRTADARADFNSVSRTLRYELDTFDEGRVNEVKKTLETLMDKMCDVQRILIEKWDGYVAILERSMGISLSPQRQAPHPAC